MPDVMRWILENKEEKFFLFFHFYDVHAPYVFRKDFREMYSDLDYYKELMAEVEEIFGVENFTLGYFKSLTHEEKFKLLCCRLIGNIPETIDKDVRRAASKEILSLLPEWRKSSEFKSQIQLLLDSYDAGIKYTDFRLGEFFSFLKSNDLWKNTMLVVTSDHGEEFMDHDMVTHGYALYDSLIHVPLLIKMPELSGKVVRRVSRLTELVDIMPTILDVLNIRFKGQMQGESLLALINKQEVKSKNIAFASFEIGDAPKKRSVRTDRWKYIIFDRNFSEDDEFYDLKEDSQEKRNMFGEGDEEILRLKSILSKHMRECLRLYETKYSKRRKAEDEYPEHLRKERLEVLRALGYIH
jgi:arylsulfatase A-like enzyme